MDFCIFLLQERTAEKRRIKTMRLFSAEDRSIRNDNASVVGVNGGNAAGL